MKHICIFAAQYLPHLGGVERYTYHLAKELIRRGIEVTVVTSNVDRLTSHEILDDISVYRMPCFNLLRGRYPVSKINNCFCKLHKQLKQTHFDLVIVNTRFYIHSVYGQRFGKKQDIPVITIDHGTSHLSISNSFLDTVGGWWEHFITKIGQFYCTDYYGVSRACSGWLTHFGITSKGEIYNAVDLDTINRLLQDVKHDFRKEYQIDSSATVLAFTGRLLPEKGVPQLISCVQKLVKKGHNIHLFIAGDGDLEQFVADSACAYIHPLGRLSFPSVIHLLHATDIFCLPSFSEGFSTSILEAAACHCYIVTTRRGGAGELLRTPSFGTIMEDNSEASLYEALSGILNNKSRQARGIELTYFILSNNYTWSIVVNQLLFTTKLNP